MVNYLSNHIANLEGDNAQCQNCIDTVYMDDLGDGFYRCPVCGDERDTRYEAGDPFGEDYEDEYEFEQRDDACSMCNGTGDDYEGFGKCPKCDGEGFYWWL